MPRESEEAASAATPKLSRGPGRAGGRTLPIPNTHTPPPPPVSRPADLVQWSSGSALTLCIMSQTVHHSLCASDAVAQCGTCSTATACG